MNFFLHFNKYSENIQLQGLYQKWPTFFQLKSWPFTKSGQLLATFSTEGNSNLGPSNKKIQGYSAVLAIFDEQSKNFFFGKKLDNYQKWPTFGHFWVGHFWYNPCTVVTPNKTTQKFSEKMANKARILKKACKKCPYWE